MTLLLLLDDVLVVTGLSLGPHGGPQQHLFALGGQSARLGFEHVTQSLCGDVGVLEVAEPGLSPVGHLQIKKRVIARLNSFCQCNLITLIWMY